MSFGQNTNIRAQKLISTIQNIRGAFSPVQAETLIAELAAYESHGHGKNLPSYSHGRGTKSTGKTYLPNGARECARRLRQIGAGSGD